MKKIKKNFIYRVFCMMMTTMLCVSLLDGINVSAFTHADYIAGSYTNLSAYSNADLYLTEDGAEMLIELSIKKDKTESIKITVIFYDIYGNIVKERDVYDYLSGICATGDFPPTYHAVSIPLSASSYSVILSTTAFSDYVTYSTCKYSETGEYVDSSVEIDNLSEKLILTVENSASVSTTMYYNIAVFDDQRLLKDVAEGTFTVVPGTNKLTIKKTGTYCPSKWIYFTGISNPNWIPDDMDDGNSNDNNDSDDDTDNSEKPSGNIWSYSYGRLAYGFLNSAKDLGYSEGDSIPLSIYKVFFSDNQAQYLKALDGAWGGSCFGFSSSSIILNNPNADLSYTMFNPTATKVSELKISDQYKSVSESWTVKQLLEGLQVMQYNEKIQHQMWTETESKFVSATLLNKCKAISTGDIPVVIGIHKDGVGGHAVVPYELQVFSNTEDRLYIYDCNFNSADRYITLYKSNGQYTGEWLYRVNDYYDFGTNYNSTISYCDYETFYKAWTNRNKTMKSNIISIDTDKDIVIFDGDQKQVAVISATGEFTSYDSDIYRMISLDGFHEVASDQVIVSAPEGEYTVSSSDITNMEITIAGTVKKAEYNGACESFHFNVTEDKNEVEFSGCQSQKYSIALTSTDQTSDYVANGVASTQNMNANQTTGLAESNGSETTEETHTLKQDVNNANVSTNKSQIEANKAKQVGKIKSIHIKRLSKSKKKVKCKISYKSKVMADGYQIKINGKIVERKGKSYKTILKRGKKHTIRVRPYVINEDGSVIYGKWKTKKIKL